MKNFKLFVRDVLYVSKVTGTGNKKILVFASVFLSQLTAVIDIFIIMVFSVIIVDEFSGIQTFDNILIWFQTTLVKSFIANYPPLLKVFLVETYQWLLVILQLKILATDLL